MDRLIPWVMVLMVAAGPAGTTPEAAAQPAKPKPEAAAGTAPLVEHSRVTIAVGEFSGVSIAELSGIAWDPDQQLLYAVSDKGSVVHVKLRLDGNKIATAELVYAARLGGPEGDGSKGKGVDAEDLVVLNAANGRAGDTELVVVTERMPRFARFSPSGAPLGQTEVPAPLNDRSNYRGSKGLESVAYHPRHGLLTASESPLKADPEDKHTIYASDRRWSFTRLFPDSRLKAMALLADGNVVALERSRSASSKSVIASLRHIDLATCAEDKPCTATDLAILPEARDNFEGLAHLGDGRFLLVSDHSARDRQGTTLMLLAPR